jgi:2-polyprenyl-3-methyl-5-hydroxy-6-metoxy-1,4-benzoquinol methylase
MNWNGDAYQRRFDSLAASGVNVHGEADFVEQLNPTSVLDAGCGTGRVARELARRGIDVVGVDMDESMITTARRLAPDLTWLVRDLTGFDLGRAFDVVLLAGNVPIFTPEGTQASLVAGCARHLTQAGLLVAGFQLDRRYSLSSYDEHCRRVGLECTERWSSWSRTAFTETADYAVSIHRCAP